MNGVLLVDKSSNKTSRDVVNSLNDFFEMNKIGHSGTLDPLATGLLVIALGKCTKLNDLLTNYDKEYITTMKLGIKTDSYDITGNVLSEVNVNLTEEYIKETILSFKGRYTQEVPKYSAVKIDGKKLYEYARNNEEVVLPKKEVEIKELEILSIEDNLIKFRCLVSKGTYIRSLINDIGNKLGCGATMIELRRTKQGNFLIDEAFTLQQVFNNEYKIISIEELFSSYPKEEVTGNKLTKVKNGALLEKDFIGDYISYYEGNKLIAIYMTYQKDTQLVKPLLML